MPTRSTFFDDGVFASSVMRGLIFESVWNSGSIGYHLEFSDHDGNGRDDWSEDGAGAAMRRVFDLWSDVADLTFFETSRTNATLIERITDAGSGEDGGTTLAFHYLPGGNSEGSGLRSGEQSDGEYNHDAQGWNALGLTQGGTAFSTMIHEIGHALGLEHPFDDDLFTGLTGDAFGDYGNFGLNQGIYTVMTYNRGWVDNRGRSPDTGWGHSGTPMALDIAAVQAIYGANMTHALGDDTYTLRDFNAQGTFYSTIWDAGGTDTISYTGSADANVFLDEATIDDTPTGGGLLSYIENVYGGFTVAQGTVIENARTGSGDDVVGGNAANNRIESGAGADIVMGLGGDDTIYGGSGDDIIMGDYRSVAEFGIALTPAPPPYPGPDLPSGLSQGSGTIFASPTTANTSRFSAIDVSDEFRLRAVRDIEGEETLYSVTVDATSGSGFGYYSFTLTEAGRITLDIDGAWGGPSGSFDAYIQIENPSGVLIAENDDSALDDGSVQYSNRTLDSFIDITLDPGTYYVKVGQFSPDGPAPLTSGSTYDLHIVADAYVVDAPPMLPASGLAQFGYYYETPDFSEAIGGYNRGTDAPAHVHDAQCACHSCAGDKPEVSAEDVLLVAEDAIARASEWIDPVSGEMALPSDGWDAI